MDNDTTENKVTKYDLGPVEQVSYHLLRATEILAELAQGKRGEISRLISIVKTKIQVARACHDGWIARSDENFRHAPAAINSKSYNIKQGLELFLIYGYEDVVMEHDELFAGGRVGPEDDIELKRLGWSFVSNEDGYSMGAELNEINNNSKLLSKELN